MRPMSTTVLIVDDHATFRSFASALLQAEGYTVVGEAGDGATALREFRRLRPDVVLLDIQLPDIDGFEVTKQLAAEGNGTAVVLVSSRDASDYRRRLAGSTARGFIAKASLSGATLAAVLGSGR
jgi:DNA-binding NarL/FixJ family response regulator